MDVVYVPYVCDITAITSVGLTTVVTTAIPHAFILGNTVSFLIPQQWGTRQLTGKRGIVIARTEFTVTVNINSSAFDPFVTPSPPEFVVIQSPQLIPIGDINIGYEAIGNFVPFPATIPGAFQNFPI